MFNEIKEELNADCRKYISSMIKNIAFANLRLSGNYANLAHELVKKNKSFPLKEELYEKTPTTYSGFVWLGFPVTITFEERKLNTGYMSTDTIVTAVVPRPFVNRFKKIMNDLLKADGTTVSVSILQQWGSEKISEIPIPDQLEEPLVSKLVYDDIDLGIGLAIEKNTKTGAILHGPPGNGKTSLVKWLAQKYRLPISVAAFNDGFDNHTVIKLFSNLRSPSIVLFEDFDAYFDHRTPRIENQKFSFDTLLGIIDGIYSPNGAIIFIMTANDIGSVDEALKCRPSRFRFVKEVGNPDKNIRERIFCGLSNAKKLVKDTEGLSLDQVLDTLEKNK